MFQRFTMTRGRALQILVGSSLLIAMFVMQGCFVGPRPYYGGGGGYPGWAAPAPTYFFAPPRPVFAPPRMAYLPPRPFYGPVRPFNSPGRAVFARPYGDRARERRAGTRVARERTPA